jgi:SAM-dependent methyltransferase
MLKVNDINVCPFCQSDRVVPAFERIGKLFGLCEDCRSYLWLQPTTMPDPYAAGDFAARAERCSAGPDYRTFQEFSSYLKMGTLLEIGPGTGAFLAAARDAGFDVKAIETSAYHREYIRKKWGIIMSAGLLETAPALDNVFDNVVRFNCIEHVLDLNQHLVAITAALKLGGRFIVSTCNARSLQTRIAGRWWSMFKQPDHVNIPSAKGLRAIGIRVGLVPLRVWSSEYPLETFVSLAVSMKDWFSERRPSTEVNHPIGAGAATVAYESIGRRLVRARLFAAVGGTISWFGLGGSVKVVFEKRGHATTV